jgi:hypothetical protein
VKIILSRKGFDSEYGGHPSPILPEGKLVSLPIPQHGDLIKYSDLEFKHDITYYDLMRQLFSEIKCDSKNNPLTVDTECHLDPDIYQNIYKRHPGWRYVFGQSGSAQGHLNKLKIEKDDLFLFFGRFRQTQYINDKLSYIGKTDRHIIFGYFQIGEKFIPSQTKDIPEWMRYHSHTLPLPQRNPNNTIYIATTSLSWDSNLPGAGVFSYDRSLVLTKEGYGISKWQLPDYFKDVSISRHHKDSWKEDYFQSVAMGQEIVIQENHQVEKWAKELINNNVVKKS